MKRILCIWLPQWPLQRLRAAQPALDSRPLVLHTADSQARAHSFSHSPLRRGPRVVAGDAAAQALGIRSGMPLAEAQALARRQTVAGRSSLPATLSTSGLVHWESWDPAADRAALEQLARLCERFSPLVGLEPPGNLAESDGRPPEDLVLDITGLATLFGTEARLAGQVLETLGAAGYRPRVAVADTLGAAWAVAHTGAGEERHLPRVVPPGQAWSVLAALPISALRLSEAHCRLLAQLGLERIDQLARLPRAGLAARLGPAPLRRLDQALDRAPEPIVPLPTLQAFQAQWNLEPPLSQRALLTVVVERLMERVAAELARRDQGAVQLVCTLRCAARVWPLRVDLFQPSACPRHLAQLVQLPFERLVLPGPIDQVCVQAPLTARLVHAQGELFTDRAARAARPLGLLVERLSSRLGRDNVVRPRLEADAQPEQVCRWTPWTGRSRPAPRPAAGHLPESAGARPLRIVTPPQPLLVVSVVPDGPPIWFDYQRRRHRVTCYWGPERIETGWWRGPSVRRDYYRVETESGSRFWLYRQLDDGQWLLHGEFQ